MTKMTKRQFIISSLGFIVAAALPFEISFNNKCGEVCYALKSNLKTYLIDEKSAEIIQIILNKKNIKPDVLFNEICQKYHQNDIEKVVNFITNIL